MRLFDVPVLDEKAPKMRLFDVPKDSAPEKKMRLFDIPEDQAPKMRLFDIPELRGVERAEDIPEIAPKPSPGRLVDAGELGRETTRSVHFTGRKERDESGRTSVFRENERAYF